MDWIYYPVSQALVALHTLLAPLTGAASGLTWALMIVVMTLVIRTVLLPFHLRMWHTQRRIAASQPQMKEINARFQERVRELQTDTELDPAERKKQLSALQADHVKAFQTVNEENGVRWRNLFIPIVIQGFVGFLLFHVLRTFQPGSNAKYGIPAEMHQAGVETQILGAPISVTATTAAEQLEQLGAVPGTVRLVALGLIALITITSIISYRESMKRNERAAATTAGPDEAAQQILKHVKKGPYILFGFLALIYLALPVGLLVGVLVTTIWMAAYQEVLLRRTLKAESAKAPGKSEE